VRFEGGRKVVIHGVARRREEWEVLIRDHHDGYISWEEYNHSQKVITGNANIPGRLRRRPHSDYCGKRGCTYLDHVKPHDRPKPGGFL
jgi:hypothetical protein